MAVILAIDTSTRRRVVVVTCSRDGEVISATVVDDTAVVSALAAAVRDVEAESLEAVVVAVGPGSYSGVRTGMAAALGVAHSRGLPLHGVGSLEMVAYGADPGATNVVVASDASRGGVFTAAYRREEGVWVETSAPRRVLAAGLGAAAVVATAPVPGLAGVVIADPVEALARASAVAITTPPLDPARLTAVQVTAPVFAEIPAARE